jgi:hypothetical protein
MTKPNLESTKRILADEIKTHDYTRENLYGNAGASRKLEDYIIVSVLSGVTQGDCLDWIVNSLKEYDVQQDYIQTTRSSAELQYSILHRAFNGRLKQSF